MKTNTFSSEGIMRPVELYNTRLFVAGHVTEVYGQVQALTNYLKCNTREFVCVTHPFSYCSIPRSKCVVYVNGEPRVELTGYWPPFLHYVRDVLLNLYWAWKLGGHYDLFVGIDNLNAFCGIILRRLGVVNRVIYYVLEYTPKRFENRLLNFVYHKVDGFCARHADYVWSVSQRIAETKVKYGVDSARNTIVPVGVDLDKIVRVPFDQLRRNVMVFVSHLTQSKGVQLVIESMKDIVQAVPDARLEIIGTGPYEGELRQMVTSLRLEEHIRFLGLMSQEQLLDYLPRCGIALATYMQDLDNISYYTDPMKVQVYLACGLPVIITKVPQVARLIGEYPMGIAIDYDRQALVKACLRLLTDDGFYEPCKSNALEYASQLSWDKIYDEAFGKVLRVGNGL